MGAGNARGPARVESVSNSTRAAPSSQELDAALARAVVAEALVTRKDAQIDRMIAELEEATANSMMQQQAIQAEHEVEVQKNRSLSAQLDDARVRVAELADELDRERLRCRALEGARGELRDALARAKTCEEGEERERAQKKVFEMEVEEIKKKLLQVEREKDIVSEKLEKMRMERDRYIAEKQRAWGSGEDDEGEARQHEREREWKHLEKEKESKVDEGLQVQAWENGKSGVCKLL